MTQEQKELLLKDLCARLQYGVKCKSKYFANDTLSGIIIDEEETMFNFSVNDEGFITQLYCSEFKPYLFPLESMSEEQKKYVTDRWGINENFNFEIDPDWGKYFVELGDVLSFIDWCYENHLDINGLIPKGLSLDATGLNIY